jgi:hypothetical protein
MLVILCKSVPGPIRCAKSIQISTAADIPRMELRLMSCAAYRIVCLLSPYFFHFRGVWSCKVCELQQEVSVGLRWKLQ